MILGIAKTGVEEVFVAYLALLHDMLLEGPGGPFSRRADIPGLVQACRSRTVTVIVYPLLPFPYPKLRISTLPS